MAGLLERVRVEPDVVDPPLRVPDRNLDDGADRGLDRLEPRVGLRFQNERVKPCHRLLPAVGVQGEHRAAVAGVERTDQLQGFGAADLADDQPVG